MSGPTFEELTLRRSTAGAKQDLLTLDSVDDEEGNGSAVRFVDNSQGRLPLVLGRLRTSRADSTTARLDLEVSSADLSKIVSGEDTTALLSLVGRTGNVGVGTTNPASKLDVAGALHVGDALNLDGRLEVAGQIQGRDGTLSISGAANVQGAVTVGGGFTV